tara:strand:+ start:7224 stop:7586 length:363 start_codon:yes stop_codon:yes gene_type:complete
MIRLEYKNPDGTSESIDAELRELKGQDKVKGAFLSFLAFIALACVSVFIPVAHFILVPLFFGLALYFAYSAFQHTLEVGEFVFTCPSCNHKITSKKQRVKEALKLHCPNCRHQVYIRAVG